MESQTECKNTTETIIQNTSQSPNDLKPNEQQTKQDTIVSGQPTESATAKSNLYFTLLDLELCQFSLDGETVLNAQDATNEQFDALAQVVANVTNVKEWYLEERRDFINGLYAFCEERNYPFPFTLVDEDPEEKTPTAPLQAEKEIHNDAE